jgi:hypothetical protein
MGTKCQRCCAQIDTTVYLVTSQEDDVVLLRMLVCRACYIEAQHIGLGAREIANSGLIETRTPQ